MLSQDIVPSKQLENEVLLCCARTHPDVKTLERLRTLLHQDPDWQRLIQMANSNGVVPLLYRNLSRSCPDAVPPTILAQLRESFRSNVQNSLLLTAELLKLVELFALHGVSAIPFKGPVLATAAYEDLALRQFSDLDILVKRDDILKAGNLLASQGYEPATDSSAASEEHLDPEDVAYLGPQFYTFVHPDRGTRIDVQWRLTRKYFSFSLEDGQGRGRLVPVTVGDRSVLTFAPMDLLLILCAHGAKHQWQELKWICDVAELVRTEKETIDWEKLQREASRQGVRRVLNLGLLLARDLLGAELPEDVSKAVHRDFTRGGSVVRRIVSKLFLESIEPYRDFDNVIFYLRTMDRWQDRVRFCSAYLSQSLRAVVTPTSKEREFLSLPVPFFFLYYFLRPLRLTVKYLRLGLMRLSRRQASG